MASSRIQNHAVALAFLVVLASSVVGNTSAATYSLNWAIPSGGAADYATYASQHTFHVGDILVFNFQTGAHSLANVTKQSFDSCSSSNPISLVTVGPARVNLTSPGEAYFICTFTGQCPAGQKLAINVSSAAATPTIPPPAPSPNTVTPPPVATPPTPSAAAPSPEPAAPAPTKASPVPAPAPAPAATAPTTSTPAISPAPAASVPSPAPGPGGAAPSPSPVAPSPNAPGQSPSSASAPGPGGSPADTSPPPSAAPASPTTMATNLSLIMLMSMAIFF